MPIKIKAIPAAILLLGFVAVPALCGQPKAVNNQQTPLHKNYFAIPVAVKPAKGCSLTKTPNGAADKTKKISLEASELHMSSAELLAQLSNGCLKKEKMEIKSRSSFIWNGDPTELLKVFQTSGKTVVGKWVLIVDRGESCWMVTAIYNAKDQKASQLALDMVHTAAWQRRAVSAETVAEGDGFLLGGVKTEATPFHIAGFRQGSLVYTKDGQIPTKDPDQALFVISRLSDEYVPAERREAFSEARLAEIERGAKLDVISKTAENVNGLPAVVTVAYTDSKPPALIYQATIFKASKVISLVGIARQNTTKCLESFHKLTASYREER